MPGIVAHMVVAKLVGKSLKLNSNEFIRGNILPDLSLQDNNISHHKKQGKIYLVPDISYWSKTLDLTNHQQLGFFIHLLLDWHFLEEYVPEKVKNKNAFIDKSMYSDYDILNNKLIQRFRLDKDKIKKALSTIDEEVDKPKLEYNLSCLDMKKEGETENLDEDDFSAFLFDVSETICKEVLVNAGESSKLPICTGQRKKRKYKKK